LEINKNNNNYECVKTLINSNKINSILFLDDKNIIISSEMRGVNFRI